MHGLKVHVTWAYFWAKASICISWRSRSSAHSVSATSAHFSNPAASGDRVISPVTHAPVAVPAPAGGGARPDSMNAPAGALSMMLGMPTWPLPGKDPPRR